MSGAQGYSLAGEIPKWEAGVGVSYYFQEKDGKLYLRRVEFRDGKRIDKSVGNVEVLVAIHDFFESRGIRLTTRNINKILERVLEGACPQPRKRGDGGKAPVVRPPGFEPGIAGLGGRRPSPG